MSRRPVSLDEAVAAAGRRGHRALAVGVRRGGETRFAATGGADERSRFEIGSITKAFTGVLLRDAAVRGEASLDEPLSELLPRDELAPAWPAGSPRCSS